MNRMPGQESEFAAALGGVHQVNAGGREMRHDIRFGGYSGPSKPALRSWPPHGPDAVEVLFGDFCNFLGKRWLRAENGAIQHAVAAAARMELAIEAYLANRHNDPVIDVSEGLDVEEALAVSQAVAGSSF